MFDIGDILHLSNFNGTTLHLRDSNSSLVDLALSSICLQTRMAHESHRSFFAAPALSGVLSNADIDFHAIIGTLLRFCFILILLFACLV